MKTYHFYVIRDEIVQSYFGKEHLMFDLFIRFVQARSLSMQKVLYKQIQYITKPLPQLELQRYLEQTLTPQLLYIKKGNMHAIYTTDGQLCGKLVMKQQLAQLHLMENRELEQLFFGILKQLNTPIFALEDKQEQYGWIYSVKQERN